jgi:hypothetical protein
VRNRPVRQQSSTPGRERSSVGPVRQALAAAWRICLTRVISKRFSTLRGHHQELGVVEPFWEAQLAVLVTVVLYVALPSRLTVGPRWLAPCLEGLLLFGLAISTPYRHHSQSPVRRRMSIGLIAVVTAANFAAEGLLVHYLLKGGGTGGRALVLSAAQIWFTNVAVFGLWFWEIDRGGPHMRDQARRTGLPLSPDGSFRAIAKGLASGVLGLPVCLIHERKRIQPDRCHATERSHQEPDADRVDRVISDRRAGRRPRGQHPQHVAPCGE